MTKVSAVVFDFIGTLAELTDYSLENAKDKMFKSLVESGFSVYQKGFLKAYNRAHEKYREVRYGQLIEVTNAVWVSEALNLLGYDTTPQDERVKTAVNVFFGDYLRALRLRPSAKATLQKLSQNHKLAIISNYTYAPVIYAGLRKLGVNDFFRVVVVSEAVGSRKPGSNIFREALKRLRANADEAIYVGDTPLEDIQGAKSAGMKTVFIPSQFNSLTDMQRAPQKPDYIIETLSDLLEILNAQ